MKIKYFLRGIGIGMIITAILLGISYKSKMTDEEVILKAKKLGMVFEDSSEESVTPAATDVADNTSIPEYTELPGMTAMPEITITPEETVQPEVTTAPKETAVPGSNSKSQSKLVINSGDSSRMVSERLESIGIIEDSEKFDKYLVDNGYAEKLSVGEYSVSNDLSFKKIAEVITK